MQEVDFSDANLSGCSFDNSNLLNTTFVNTNLEKADFRLAENFHIDPEMNRVKKAKFSNSGLIGLLGKYDIVVKI